MCVVYFLFLDSLFQMLRSLSTVHGLKGLRPKHVLALHFTISVFLPLDVFTARCHLRTSLVTKK
jgi:hypothetical protein